MPIRSKGTKAYTGDNPLLAYWGRPKPKASIDVWVAIAITMVLAAYRLVTEMSLPLNLYFSAYSEFRVGTIMMNVLFFWLLALLWIAYRRWQTAEGTRQELERIVSSINPDVLIVADETRVIRLCTGAARSMFGYAHDEIVGQTTDLLYADRRHCGQKGQLYRLLEDVGFHIGTASGLHRDGRRFPLELITGRIQGESGGVVILLRDITARHEAEEALRASEARFEQFMCHLPACACIKDSDGRLVYLNTEFARSFGLHPETALGKTDNDLFPRSYATAFRAADAEVIARRSALQRTEQMPQRHTVRSMLTCRFPILREGSEPLVGLIAVDITDKQQAEEERLKLEMQMQRAQKLESLGLLGGGIAHDFNNLLMGILGNADLALMQLPEDSPVRHYIEEVVAISRRAADVTNQLLAYSGEGKFTIEVVDLSAIVRDMTHLLQISVKKKAHLVFNLADGLPAIECDVTQIRQVIMNLVINASDALIDVAGTITVETGVEDCSVESFQSAYLAENLPPGRYVCLRVTDEGCGMDTATLNRIFDPFFSTKFTGRGLGLASVLGIVRGHKGAIAVTSQKDAGSVFTVYVPASTKVLEVCDEDEQDPEDVWTGSGTVLVVDDEETVRDVAERMLQIIGFDTKPMTNGRAAVTWFEKHPGEITAILMDTTMPVMDGIEAAREIRKRSPDVPIVLSSGYKRYEEFSDIDVANPPRFLHKPYRLDAIRKCMREILEPAQPEG